MKYRLVEWHQKLYIVVGIGYNANYDPPDVFYVVSLENSLLKSLISNIEAIEIPFYEATEITDKAKLRTIWVLYGG